MSEKYDTDEKHGCKHSVITADITVANHYGPCDMPAAAVLLDAYYRLAHFIRCDPVLHCAFVDLRIGGNGAD